MAQYYYIQYTYPLQVRGSSVSSSDCRGSRKYPELQSVLRAQSHTCTANKNMLKTWQRPTSMIAIDCWSRKDIPRPSFDLLFPPASAFLLPRLDLRIPSSRLTLRTTSIPVRLPILHKAIGSSLSSRSHVQCHASGKACHSLSGCLADTYPRLSQRLHDRHIKNSITLAGRGGSARCRSPSIGTSTPMESPTVRTVI